jgi:glycosyltransferase involved in cell wall biosynthesis
MNIPVVGHLRRPNNTAQKLMRLGCHKCDAMIAISARTRRELMSTPIAIQNIHLISDSVDTAAFTTGVERSLRAELGLEDQLLFGLVARVYPSKRQLDFLQAARQLLEQDANVHFVLVGRIEDEPYWQTLKAFIAQHRLENRIHCLGHRNDITQVIASLDVLVSLAGGSVMYEAMALGKTVISAGFTRPEDSTHVIDQVTGLVTPSLEPQALVHLMRRALEDATLRARLGQAAQAWAQSHFSKTVLVKKTEDTYKQVLGARKSSPWFLTG